MGRLTTIKTLLAAGAMTVGAGAASAATISVVDGTTVKGMIDCGGGCMGLFNGSLNGTSATFYPQPSGGQNADHVRNYLASLTTEEIPTLAIRSDLGEDTLDGQNDGSNATFSSLGVWVAFKLGNNYAFVKNVSGSSLTYSWTQSSGPAGGAAGLSNITEIGVIPLPAAGWLLFSGLGALGIAGYRRRKQDA